MARGARSEVFDPREVSVFHCINRCVRQAFLCGRDPVTKKNYDHRKRWIEQRMEFLAAWFAIDVIGFAIMSNHFHVILRNRPDVVDQWSDRDVAYRWLMICPERKHEDGTPKPPTDGEIDALIQDEERLAELRIRLSHISWFMSQLAGPLGRRANIEDGTSGRFWQGRFKSTKLCDPVAILACLMYVDLNPIRAELATTPESSEYTSVRRRINAVRDNAAANWLAPLCLVESDAPGPQVGTRGQRCSDKGCVPCSLEEYLMLLEWSGRRIVEGKRGSIPTDLPPILSRLGLEADHLYRLATRFGRLFFRMAGRPASLAQEAERRGRRWYQAPGSRLFISNAI